MVISNYEKMKIKKLEERNIVCETLYYNADQNSSQIYVRSTDGKMLENVQNKSIKEKRYFLNNECVYVENEFNPLILYTINSYNDEEEIIGCPNCGNKGKVKDFIDGCPYCNTDFNFGINNSNIPKKLKLAKIVSENFFKNYFFIMLVLLLILLLIFLLVFRQFLIIGFMLWIYLFLPVFIVLFIADCIFRNIKMKTDPNGALYTEEDQKIVWESYRDENQFYNDFNKALTTCMFNEKDLIDFDILECISIDFLTSDNVDITIKIRKLYYNVEFSKSLKILKVSMKYIAGNKVEGNYSILKCPNCGSSVDASSTVCKYCNCEIHYNRSWIIDNIDEFEI